MLARRGGEVRLSVRENRGSLEIRGRVRSVKLHGIVVVKDSHFFRYEVSLL